MPDSAQSASTIGPFYQNADPDQLGASENMWLTNVLEDFRQNLFFKLLGGFTNVVSAVGDGITSVIEAITGIAGGSLFDLDQWSNQIRDGQLDLLDRVDLLSPLQDFNSCYALGQGNLINTGRVPFNKRIGPAKGATLVNDGWTLGSPGLWDVRARLAFSFTAAIGGGGYNWEIRVLTPGGSIFSQQFDYGGDGGIMTREMNTTVVVPEAGYRVEVWITQLIVGRATIGGPGNNRFTVQHITDSTANPI